MPIKKDPSLSKNIVINFVCNSRELELIDSYCNYHGIGRSDFIRESMHQKIGSQLDLFEQYLSIQRVKDQLVNKYITQDQSSVIKKNIETKKDTLSSQKIINSVIDEIDQSIQESHIEYDAEYPANNRYKKK